MQNIIRLLSPTSEAPVRHGGPRAKTGFALTDQDPDHYKQPDQQSPAKHLARRLAEGAAFKAGAEGVALKAGAAAGWARRLGSQGMDQGSSSKPQPQQGAAGGGPRHHQAPDALTQQQGQQGRVQKAVMPHVLQSLETQDLSWTLTPGPDATSYSTAWSSASPGTLATPGGPSEASSHHVAGERWLASPATGDPRQQQQQAASATIMYDADLWGQVFGSAPATPAVPTTAHARGMPGLAALMAEGAETPFSSRPGKAPRRAHRAPATPPLLVDYSPSELRQGAPLRTSSPIQQVAPGATSPLYPSLHPPAASDTPISSYAPPAADLPIPAAASGHRGNGTATTSRAPARPPPRRLRLDNASISAPTVSQGSESDVRGSPGVDGAGMVGSPSLTTGHLLGGSGGRPVGHLYAPQGGDRLQGSPSGSSGGGSASPPSATAQASASSLMLPEASWASTAAAESYSGEEGGEEEDSRGGEGAHDGGSAGTRRWGSTPTSPEPSTSVTPSSSSVGRLGAEWAPATAGSSGASTASFMQGGLGQATLSLPTPLYQTPISGSLREPGGGGMHPGYQQQQQQQGQGRVEVASPGSATASAAPSFSFAVSPPTPPLPPLNATARPDDGLVGPGGAGQVGAATASMPTHPATVTATASALQQLLSPSWEDLFAGREGEGEEQQQHTPGGGYSPAPSVQTVDRQGDHGLVSQGGVGGPRGGESGEGESGGSGWSTAW